MTHVRSMRAEDWPEVAEIYRQGIEDGEATFEIRTPPWSVFDSGRVATPRLVAESGAGAVVGWAAASLVSSRAVYRGVIEHSVYVRRDVRGRGLGRLLLEAFVAASDAAGYWTIQSSIFPENTASLRLHEIAGFRRVGTRERIARSHLGVHAGLWRDTVLVERRRPADRPTVLFVCVHNAGRSQMAAGYLRALGGGAIDVLSAGSEPKEQLNPAAVAAMAEDGIDIAGRTPTLLTVDAVGESDVVITMGCGDACPIFPGRRYEDWVLDDPAGQPIEVVRRIRDEIRRRVEALVERLLAG